MDEASTELETSAESDFYYFRWASDCPPRHRDNSRPKWSCPRSSSNFRFIL